MRTARFRVAGRFTPASAATVTIIHDPGRDAGMLRVRPLRSHREYTLDLAAVAGIVMLRVAQAEASERKRAKRSAR